MIAWKHTSNVSRNLNDARSCRRSLLLKISAQRRHIINPGRFFTGGLPAERKGDRGAVPLQDRLPSTVLSLLHRKSPESGFQGGVYGDNIIDKQSSSDVSSDPNEWSHSCKMRKQRKKT